MVVTLGEDLVREILERLPAKSLIRFQSVEPSWSALFKTHNFITKQMQRQKQWQRAMMIDPHDEIFGSMTVGSCLRSLLCDEDPPHHHEIQDLKYPSFPSPHNSYLHSICTLGHCNGVFHLELMFADDDDDDDNDDEIDQIVLWNPATRDFKLVPPPPDKPFKHSDDSDVYSGFGPDPNTDNNFKIIQFYVFSDDDGNVLPLPSAEVYNLSTDSWTLIHHFEPNDIIIYPNTPMAFRGDAPFGSEGIALANGVYHWLYSDSSYILCFDFRCNQFRKLETPSIPPARSTSILEVDDSIAYLVSQDLDENIYTQVEIWIFKHDSWSKIYHIEPFPCTFTICAVWNDGTEFFGYGTNSAFHYSGSYNSDGQLVRQFYSGHEMFYMVKYVESMVPLSINLAI